MPAHESPLVLKIMTDGLRKNLQFGPFELSSKERMLRRDGVVLPLGGRALDILIYLAERPGEVIAKKELIDHVWPNVTVEEGSLRVHVAAIRKALRDGQFGSRYIANIKGRGYSFVGTVVPFCGATDSSRASRRWPDRSASAAAVPPLWRRDCTCPAAGHALAGA
jgi:DNA-binding winged helix-turn-helix (wHTH) protein